MFRHLSRLTSVVVMAIAVGSFAILNTARAADDPLIGTFRTPEGAKSALTIQIKAGDEAGSYTGTIEKGGQSFPMKGVADSKNGARILGSFSSGQDRYSVAITLEKDQLTVASDNATYTLFASRNPLAGAANPAAQPAGIKPGETVVLMPQKVVDEAMKMHAMSLLVPEGWKLDGQISWIPAGAGLTASFIAVLDPATNAMGEFYPQISCVDGIRESQLLADRNMTGGRMRDMIERQLAEGNISQSGAEIRHIPATPLDYINQFLVPRYRPDLKGVEVKIVENKDLPEYAGKIAGRANNGTGLSSRIRVTYAQGDQKIEEVFICTLIRQPIGVGPQAWSIWSAEVDSYRAPAGKLDGMMPIFLAVKDSITTELPWFNLVSQIADKIITAEKAKLQAMIHDTAVRMDAMHEYAREAQADVSDRIRNNFQAQQTAKAAAHDKFMDYVNDLQKVQNPATGQMVKVPAGYSRVYQSSNGGIIVSNDPTYAPPVTPNTSWTQLQAAK